MIYIILFAYTFKHRDSNTKYVTFWCSLNESTTSISVFQWQETALYVVVPKSQCASFQRHHKSEECKSSCADSGSHAFARWQWDTLAERMIARSLAFSQGAVRSHSAIFTRSLTRMQSSANESTWAVYNNVQCVCVLRRRRPRRFIVIVCFAGAYLHSRRLRSMYGRYFLSIAQRSYIERNQRRQTPWARALALKGAGEILYESISPEEFATAKILCFSCIEINTLLSSRFIQNPIIANSV